jgi:hypothetical protein
MIGRIQEKPQDASCGVEYTIVLPTTVRQPTTVLRMPDLV